MDRTGSADTGTGTGILTITASVGRSPSTVSASWGREAPPELEGSE